MCVCIVTLKGFLHYSTMNSDSDCSVLLFIPIFTIYAHDSLFMRGYLWVGRDAWIYGCVCVCLSLYVYIRAVKRLKYLLEINRINVKGSDL